MGWGQTLAIFGVGALLLFVATHLLIPVSSETTGVEPIVFWFLLGGLGVFAPLVLAGSALLIRELQRGDRALWTDRLRFRRMNRGDWVWSVGATATVGVLSAGMQAFLGALPGGFDPHPPFMAFEPLTAGRYWILAA